MKLILPILLVLVSLSAAAALTIDRVDVDCGDDRVCSDQKSRFAPLKDTYRNITHLRQTLKVLVSRGGFRDFRWELDKREDKQVLFIRYTPKMVIGTVRVEAPQVALQEHVERNTRLRVESWYEPSLFPEEEMRLRQYLGSKGYPNASVTISGRRQKTEMELRFMVKPGRPQVIKRVVVKTASPVVQKFAEFKFNQLLGLPMDLQEARIKADELETDLFNFGYYLASVTLNPIGKGRTSTLEVTIAPVELYTFDLRQKPEDVKMELGPVVKDIFRRYRRPLDEASLKLGVQELLQKRGYLSPRVGVTRKRIKNKHGEEVHAFQLDMDPGERTRVRKVTFIGATLWPDAKLQTMWREQSQELAQAGFYDEDSNKAFAEWLKGQYIRNGYVRAEIAPPRVVPLGPAEVTLEYNVIEGARVLVDDISLSGITAEEQSEILDAITTKQGSPFNPFQFTEDIQTVSDMLQGRGWYYAEVTNQDAEDIVVYGRDLTSVKVHIRIRKGKFITFNRLVIVGNRRTKMRVIRRKSMLKAGTPLTPAVTKEYENVLSSMGLFSSVKVRPIPHTGDTPLTDVAVEVSERDYGLIEVAPGYRTDLGVKVSGTISYLNLFGSHRSLSLTGQVNQRLDFDTFDPRRRDEGKRMVEYNLGTQYNQPDIFDTYIDYGASANFQRRRFYAFDADILRLSNTVTRDLNTRYSVALRHQFERLNQFDATEARENGSFTIGAITPSFTADFRNTRLNPTSGAWFNVSNEYANPYFLSQKNDDLTINFYKFISRNRFYLPLPNGTLAISVVGGIQENLAREVKRDSSGNPVIDPATGNSETKGYIPGIKLFRLTGTDIVRGFSDEEINRLPNGNDIGEDRIQRRAYMANLKVEPRYFINDTLMAGVFFDAGRVYKDEVDFGDLRQSVGVTFKVVTPVGTLDFDYGVKLLRKRNESGTLESPGRFHVSIGFF
jgi:outer membrane protein insertion porin family